jgi:hypothetical protein
MTKYCEQKKGLHGKSSVHYFWPGLIALLKNTLPIDEERRRRRRRGAKKKRIQVRQHGLEKIHLFFLLVESYKPIHCQPMSIQPN